MPIANVVLTNTFEEWRVISNETIKAINDVFNDGMPNITYRNLTANNTTSNTMYVNSIFVGGINVSPYIFVSYNQANTAYTHANGAFITANAAFGAQNVTSNVANAAYNQANTAYTHANGAFITANAAFGAQNVTSAVANAAYNQANTAYNFANTRFSSNGGSINGSINVTGDFNLTGNLNVLGNVISFDTTAVTVQDPLLFLANNNTADVVDIGFAAHYGNSTNVQVHTGFFRDHESKEWYLFKEYNDPYFLSINTSGHISTTGNNFTIDVLNADIRTGNLILNGTNARSFIESSFAVANAAFGQANTANTTAIAAFGQANTANTTAIAAFGQANVARTHANAAFGQANTANITAVAAFGQANTANITAVAAFAAANTSVTTGKAIAMAIVFGG